MAIKTIFLDRDGVINHEVNYLHEIEKFKFIKGIFDACKYFQKLKFEIIIVSNQSGIARGYFNESDYNRLTTWMLKEFKKNNVSILDIFHCPHSPDSKCLCRKPKPGMFFDANRIHSIDFSRSWMIGDKESDIQSANAAGILNTILVRSGHSIDEPNSKSMYIVDSIKESIDVIY